MADNDSDFRLERLRAAQIAEREFHRQILRDLSAAAHEALTAVELADKPLFRVFSS